MMQTGVPAGYLTAREIGAQIGITPRAVHHRAVARGIVGLALNPPPTVPRAPQRVYAHADVPRLTADLPRQPPPLPPPVSLRHREQIRQENWPVVEAVARAYEMTTAVLVGRGRDPLVVEARRIAMQLLADRGLGASHIGFVLDRDHSTVCHSLTCLKEKPTEEEQIMLKDLRKAVQQIGAG